MKTTTTTTQIHSTPPTRRRHSSTGGDVTPPPLRHHLSEEALNAVHHHHHLLVNNNSRGGGGPSHHPASPAARAPIADDPHHHHHLNNNGSPPPPPSPPLRHYSNDRYVTTTTMTSGCWGEGRMKSTDHISVDAASTNVAKTTTSTTRSGEAARRGAAGSSSEDEEAWSADCASSSNTDGPHHKQRPPSQSASTTSFGASSVNATPQTSSASSSAVAEHPMEFNEESSTTEVAHTTSSLNFSSNDEEECNVPLDSVSSHEWKNTLKYLHDFASNVDGDVGPKYVKVATGVRFLRTNKDIMMGLFISKEFLDRLKRIFDLTLKLSYFSNVNPQSPLSLKICVDKKLVRASIIKNVMVTVIFTEIKDRQPVEPLTIHKKPHLLPLSFSNKLHPCFSKQPNVKFNQLIDTCSKIYPYNMVHPQFSTVHHHQPKPSPLFYKDFGPMAPCQTMLPAFSSSSSEIFSISFHASNDLLSACNHSSANSSASTKSSLSLYSTPPEQPQCNEATPSISSNNVHNESFSSASSAASTVSQATNSTWKNLKQSASEFFKSRACVGSRSIKPSSSKSGRFGCRNKKYSLSTEKDDCEQQDKLCNLVNQKLYFNNDKLQNISNLHLENRPCVL